MVSSFAIIHLCLCVPEVLNISGEKLGLSTLEHLAPTFILVMNMYTSQNGSYTSTQTKQNVHNGLCNDCGGYNHIGNLTV